MSETALMTRAGPWRKGRKTNATNATFPSRIPLAVDPFITAGASGDADTATGASVIRLTNELFGGQSQSGVELLFYGVGADNTTFSARVIGWSPMVSDRLVEVTPETQIWIPVVLAELACTLSAVPIGLANKAIVATELFVDTITLVGTTAVAGIDCNITSPANDTIARVYLDMWGHTELEVTFDMTGATSGNCLLRLF